jgi:hypothetical protein
MTSAVDAIHIPAPGSCTFWIRPQALAVAHWRTVRWTMQAAK